MKKIYTFVFLLCSFAFVSTEAEAAESLSFNFLKAYNLENSGNLVSGENPIATKKGDFCFELSVRDENNNETIVAHVYASTATRTKEHIVGAYRIGAIGSFSYIYEDGETLRCPSGSMYVECVGDTSIEFVEGKPMKMPLYRIRLFDVLTTTGRRLNLEGARIPAMCINKAEYDAMDQASLGTNDGWFYFPLDKPADAVEIPTAVYRYNNYTNTQGVWLVQGLNFELSKFEVVLVAEAADLTGAAPSVLTVGQNNSPLTVIYEYGEDFSESTSITITSGYGVVWDGDDARHYDFYLTATDKTVYHVTMASAYVISGDSQINVEHSYASANIYKENFSVYVYAQDDNSAVSMIFYVDGYDDDIVIPEGTYSINGSRQPFTIKASRGIEWASYLLDDSFFTTLDAEGYADEITYLRTGTVQVTNNGGLLDIAMDARNSLEKSVKINITTTVTDIRQTQADNAGTDAVKVLDERGNIVIIRNGIRYNLQGMQVR